MQRLEVSGAVYIYIYISLGGKGLILYQMSSAFVIINLCYVYNQWYDISCATLYIRRWTEHIKVKKGKSRCSGFVRHCGFVQAYCTLAPGTSFLHH
jgi:hypothetical protein